MRRSHGINTNMAGVQSTYNKIVRQTISKEAGEQSLMLEYLISELKKLQKKVFDTEQSFYQLFGYRGTQDGLKEIQNKIDRINTDPISVLARANNTSIIKELLDHGIEGNFEAYKAAVDENLEQLLYTEGNALNDWLKENEDALTEEVKLRVFNELAEDHNIKKFLTAEQVSKLTGNLHKGKVVRKGGLVNSLEFVFDPNTKKLVHNREGRRFQLYHKKNF